MALVLLQAGTATDCGGAGGTITLGAPLTAGSLIVAGQTGQNFTSEATLNSGPVLTRIGPQVQAQPSFGNLGWAYYRRTLGGDANSWHWNPSSGKTFVLAEFGGVAGGALPTGEVDATTQIDGTNQTVGPLTGRFAFYCTRQENGTFTPNGSTSVAAQLIVGGCGPTAALLVYAAVPAGLGGSQGGTNRDGWWWGGIAFDIALSGQAMLQDGHGAML